jgi:hypothetical protein
LAVSRRIAAEPARTASLAALAAASLALEIFSGSATLRLAVVAEKVANVLAQGEISRAGIGLRLLDQRDRRFESDKPLLVSL